MRTRAPAPAKLFGVHVHTGRLRRQQVGQVADRGLLHALGGVDLRDRVADLEPALLARRGRHDRRQVHRRRAEREVERDRRAGRHRHGLRLLAVAHAEHAHGRRARRDAADGVAARVVRDGAVRRPDDDDLGGRDRLARGGVGHRTGDHSGLLGDEHRRSGRRAEHGRECPLRTTHHVFILRNTPIGRRITDGRWSRPSGAPRARRPQVGRRLRRVGPLRRGNPESARHVRPERRSERGPGRITSSGPRGRVRPSGETRVGHPPSLLGTESFTPRPSRTAQENKSVSNRGAMRERRRSGAS